MDFFNDKKLLLLEDNIELITDATSLFNMFFKKTYIAKSHNEAFKILADESIDLIISDIYLEKESGLDFIEKYRQIDDKIPIVILSGYKDEDLLLRAISLNLSGYLLKPINLKILLEGLERCKQKIIKNNEKIICLKNDFFYDKDLKKIIKNGEVFELNKKEIQFFDMICENKNKIITKDMFVRDIYEYEVMTDSALNNFILRIRKRFGKDFLYTIPGVGYKLIVS
jgi:DNA-binding response OmpR family regulator